ncbi:MAG: hypothetical protein J0I69_00250 [Altererythrobacter sp.]|nr:hypothetical protein [Altererythrobacter sp.]OJU59533.1 MAG: hypothetical protein BGO08_00670 [Altererythrobacter sp. 66-12]
MMTMSFRATRPATAAWLLARVAAGALALSFAAPSLAKDCDRACLVSVTDAYLAGLAAHDPARAPLAETPLFIENSKRLRVGEGLWAAATGRADAMGLYVPDPAAQTAGWIGVMEQSGKPSLVAIRLKLEDGRIVEAEHVVGTTLTPAQLANLQTPRASYFREIPKASRLPRGKLLTIGASYYDALDDNDGSLAPFARDCERMDNGDVAVGPNVHIYPEPDYPHIDMTCGGQFDSQVMSYITTIDGRRVFAADPVYGLVMGFSHFHHKMDVKDIRVILPDGSEGVRHLPNGPFDMVAAHIFKVGPEGQIHEIQAMGFVAPYTEPKG